MVIIESTDLATLNERFEIRKLKSYLIVQFCFLRPITKQLKIIIDLSF